MLLYRYRHTKTWLSLEEHCIFNLEDEAHPGSVEYSLADTVWTVMVFVPHFAVNQTDPCQPTGVRWMRPDHQRELPGNVFLAYCLLLKKKTSVYSPCFIVPSSLDSCDDRILSLLVFFFVQDSSKWLKCCPLYIYSMWPSHSSAWSQCEWSIWHWYRTADERLLIGYSTLNKDISSLISILFFCVPSMWYLDHCFSSAMGSRLVWVHWMPGFKGKGLCFCICCKRQTMKCSRCPLGNVGSRTVNSGNEGLYNTKEERGVCGLYQPVQWLLETQIFPDKTEVIKNKKQRENGLKKIDYFIRPQICCAYICLSMTINIMARCYVCKERYCHSPAVYSSGQ